MYLEFEVITDARRKEAYQVRVEVVYVRLDW